MDTEAKRASNRASYARNRESTLTAHRAYREANPQVAERNRASAASTYQRKKERAERDPQFREEWRIEQREIHLQKTYGITSADYERMYAEQGGGCGACGASTSPDNPNGYLHVDHDHVTEEVRGLLCKSCNQSLGLLGESVERLMGLAAYLLRFQDVIGVNRSTKEGS